MPNIVPDPLVPWLHQIGGGFGYKIIIPVVFAKADLQRPDWPKVRAQMIAITKDAASLMLADAFDAAEALNRKDA